MLRALDRTATNPNRTIPTLLSMYGAIAEQTQVLADNAGSIAAAIVDRQRQELDTDPELNGNNLASSLTNLSGRLSKLGRHEEGLTAIREALPIRHHLAEQHPAVYEEALAKSLRVLEWLQAEPKDPS